MAKKTKAHLSARIELKVTASQLRGKVDKVKVRSRGPGHIGQLKHSDTIHLGNISQSELTKRLKMAVQVLNTGKATGSPKEPETMRGDTSKKEVTKSKPGTKAPKKKEVKTDPEKPEKPAEQVVEAGANKPEVPREKGSEKPEEVPK